MPNERTQNDPAGRANAGKNQRDAPSPGGVEGTGSNRDGVDAHERPPGSGDGGNTTTAPVSGGGMAGTGDMARSRSHSGTSTTPGAGPNPGSK